MRTYKYQSDTAIEWREDSTLPDGTPQVTMGIVIQGQTRTREVQTGTETVVVGQEPVLGADGNPTYEQVPVLDENGAQVYEQVPVLDEEGNPTYEQIPVLDENGDPVVDENGDPVTEQGDQIFTDGDPLFTNGEQITQDVTEERPVFETQEYSPWDELMAEVAAGNITVADQDIEPVRQQALDLINRQRDELIAGGVTFNGHTFQTDPQSIMDIMGAVVSGTDTQWLTTDNQVVAMTVADLQALGQAVAAHKAAIVYKARQHKDAVLAHATIADIESYMNTIDWAIS